MNVYGVNVDKLNLIQLIDNMYKWPFKVYCVKTQCIQQCIVVINSGIMCTFYSMFFIGCWRC